MGLSLVVDHVIVIIGICVILIVAIILNVTMGTIATKPLL